MNKFAGIKNLEELIKKSTFDEIDAPVEPWREQEKEYNSLIKRNPELFKELIQIDSEIAELGNSRAAMELELKDESEFTEEDKILIRRIDELCEKAARIHEQMI